MIKIVINSQYFIYFCAKRSHLPVSPFYSLSILEFANKEKAPILHVQYILPWQQHSSPCNQCKTCKKSYLNQPAMHFSVQNHNFTKNRISERPVAEIEICKNKKKESLSYTRARITASLPPSKIRANTLSKLKPILIAHKIAISPIDIPRIFASSITRCLNLSSTRAIITV